MKTRGRLLATLLALVLLASCGTGQPAPQGGAAHEANPLYTLGEAWTEVQIVPEDFDENGIETTTSFLLENAQGMKAEELAEVIRFDPEVQFVLEDVEEGKARIIPGSKLKSNTVYTISALTPSGEPGRSWAFQSKRRLQVLSSTPESYANEVPVDTGIEFVFNYDGVDLTEHFTISPEMEGKFLTNGNRSAFVPSQPLNYDTRYYISLEAGVAVSETAFLEEGYSFSFRTAPDPQEVYEEVRKAPDFYLPGVQETFISMDTPLLEVTRYNISADDEFQVEVYSLTPERYLKELHAFNRTRYDKEYKPKEPYLAVINNEEPLLRFSDKAMTTEITGEVRFIQQPSYLVLPQPLEQGYYLAQVTYSDSEFGETVRQKLLQINDISLYLQSVNGESLVWMNHSGTQTLPTGGRVELLEPGSGEVIRAETVNGQGLASMTTGELELGVLHATLPDLPDYWDYVGLAKQREPTLNELYTSFFFTDRGLFMPTDQMQYWGVLRGRRETIPPGTQIEVRLYDSSAYYSVGTQPKEDYLYSVWTELEQDGSFSGNLEFSNLQSGYYRLVVLAPDGRVLERTDLRVEWYTKPTYVGSSSTDKLFYLPGETVEVEVEASFYDGTPAWGITVGEYYGERKITLDGNGKGSLRIIPNDYSTGWGPELRSYSLRNLDNTSYYSSPNIYGTYYYFPSDCVLQVEVDQQEGTPKVAATVHGVDISRLESGADIYEDYPSAFLGEPAEMELEVTVKHFQTTVVELPLYTYYDWTQKKTITRSSYHYGTEVNTLAQYTATTKNGILPIEGVPQPDEDNYYTVEVTGKDTNGRVLTERAYISLRRPIVPLRENTEDNLKRYSFQRTEREQEKTGAVHSANAYKLGENIEFTLVSNDEEEELTGRILYATSQDRFIAAEVSQSPEISITQAADYIPNMVVQGAYFDGVYIYPVSGLSVHYNSEDDELLLELDADEEKYRPGEEATLQIKVTGKDGSPVEGRVAVSVVDEALMALSDQQLAPLSALYSGGYFPNVRTYTSYTQHLLFGELYTPEPDVPNPMTGGGGGDDMDAQSSSVRENFKDTALFMDVETDAAGMAEVTFVLPDNLTSWRVSGVAVARDGLQAGTATMNLRATIPMFVKTTLGDTYLTGDDVAFAVSCAGVAVTRSTPVRYSALLEPMQAGGGLKELEIKGRTDQEVTINFGQVPMGSYRLTLWAKTNKGTDAISQEIVVVSSALELPIVQDVLLSPGGTQLELNPSRYPVVIGFADAQYGDYFQTARTLLWKNTSRADRRIAAITAKASMERFMDEEDVRYLSYVDEDLSDFFRGESSYLSYDNPGQGLRMYAYDSEELTLTAKALALLGRDHEYSSDFIRYLYQELNADLEYPPKEVAAAYMGLAAAKEPVLQDLWRMLDEPGMQGDAQQLYLCLALALIGDEDGADQIYQERIAPRLVPVGNRLHYQGETGNTEENLEYTALAMAAASLIGLEETEALVATVLDAHSIIYDPCMELAVYVKSFRPAHTGNASFQYRRNGEKHTVELRQDCIRYLRFMPEDLEGDSLRSVKGDVVATLLYQGDVEEFLAHQPVEEEAAAPAVRISKVVRPASTGDISTRNKNWLDLQLPELYVVKITAEFSDEAPYGSYAITDWLPSSLRYLPTTFSTNAEFSTTGTYAWISGEQQNMGIQLSRYLDYDRMYNYYFSEVNPVKVEIEVPAHWPDTWKTSMEYIDLLVEEQPEYMEIWLEVIGRPFEHYLGYGSDFYQVVTGELRRREEQKQVPLLNEYIQELGSGNTVEFSYLARKVHNGQFRAEDVYIQHGESQLGVRGESTVYINRTGSSGKRTFGEAG